MGTGAALSVGLYVFGDAALGPLQEVDGLADWVPPLLGSTRVIACLFLTVVIPVLRYRNWRWTIREDELDYVHGGLIKTRTIVPLSRVQHVATERGLIDSMTDATTLVIHTAAGKHKIPALGQGEAAQLRTEIAQRARVAEDV